MTVRSLLERLDDASLQQLFSDSALQKARSYVSRVHELQLKGNTLSALVQGSARRPYQTSVRLERKELFGEVSLEIATRCSCPVGNRCKHAAAVLLATRRPGALQDRPREEILRWAQTLAERTEASAGKPKKPPQQALLYAIHGESHRGGQPCLRIYKTKRDRHGAFSGRGELWHNVDQALLKPTSFVQEDDIPVLRLVREIQRRHGHAYSYGLTDTPLHGRDGAALLQAALATGRAFACRDDNAPLSPVQAGPARPATLGWHYEAESITPRLETEPPCERVLPTSPLWYLDCARGQAGPVAAEDQAVLAALMELPPLKPCELPLVSAALQDRAPRLPVPRDPTAQPLLELDSPPQPVLMLFSLNVWQIRAHRGYPGSIGEAYDCAVPLFRYGDIGVAPDSNAQLLTLPDGRPARIHRRPEQEAAALKALAAAGFEAVQRSWLHTYEQLPAGLYGLASLAHWQRFFSDTAPALRAAGWQIEWEPDFRHHLLEVSEWHADLEDQGNGWLEMSLGIDVDGQRLDLAPLLHEVFSRDPRWLSPQALAAIPDDEAVILETDAGLRLRLPATRLKPLAATLVDLFDRAGEGGLRVSAFDAPRLHEALGDGWQRQGFEQLDAWLDKLRGMRAVQPVAAPEGFHATLRPYQQEGLAWLQHLRTHDLGGILADDMGLGKTAQALAHLLTEKRAGRMDRPSLVVLPTSLVFNWAREAERFAPDLKVLKLHGKDRATRFAEIPAHDICLSTYPLLWRDKDTLAAQPWHYLILDEAQTVKNAASQGAKVVRELDARHRLCITGTPLENHLGELWSQFDFLLPGFLGDSREFANRWRTPIEKRGDSLRREVLARRLAPFILRRRKEDVATELPPKTIVVRDVEIAGRQRDLYETVRAAMDKQVRDAIAAKGFARSQIMILDALLKLRQVCCDPRLLKTPQADKVRERAKLDLLMEMLPELVDEGRKVLLFSQFTEMLGLIEEELGAARIPYVKLTGQTRKREEAVQAFQEGGVPVFLISLKAGGVGLNLTAADTVIHYDPWWNPAAENQATDRAHRIGQQKNVFVYKLVVAGSIEEKILALQEKKAALAAGVLAEDHEGDVKFDEGDLANLLAPLPEA